MLYIKEDSLPHNELQQYIYTTYYYNTFHFIIIFIFNTSTISTYIY